MLATSSDSVLPRSFAIVRKHSQNVSSKLTLVLCPAMTTERLRIADFITLTPVLNYDADDCARGLVMILAGLWITLDCEGVTKEKAPQKRGAKSQRSHAPKGADGVE
jgi:hypothetical protein